MAKEKNNQNKVAEKNQERKSENGRAIILGILKILEKYSDADHPLTREEIADKLVDDEYVQNTPTRTTISNNIKLLEEKFGYNIAEGKYGGVYLIGK